MVTHKVRKYFWVENQSDRNPMSFSVMPPHITVCMDVWSKVKALSDVTVARVTGRIDPYP